MAKRTLATPFKMPGPAPLKGAGKYNKLGTFNGGPAPTVVPAVKGVPQNQMSSFLMSYNPGRGKS